MLDLTLLVVVVVVVISEIYNNVLLHIISKGLIIFYSFGPDSACFLSNKVQMEFRSAINQRKKSEMAICLR